MNPLNKPKLPQGLPPEKGLPPEDESTEPKESVDGLFEEITELPTDQIHQLIHQLQGFLKGQTKSGPPLPSTLDVKAFEK
jgi:hypothetical protein